MSVPPPPTPAVHTLASPSGLRLQLLSHGALRRLDAHGVMVNLFAGHEIEGGPTNLWLRLLGSDGRCVQATPLLGPLSPLAWPLPGQADPATGSATRTTPGDPINQLSASGTWQGLQLQLRLCLAADTSAWFWHLGLHNTRTQALTLDLLLVQDIGLAPYDSTRLNEYYIGHYLDLSPLPHARHGTLLAARQNQPVAGRHPWALVGSLRRATRWATDARQVLGLAARAGGLPLGVQQGLPAQRLQAEHATLALQDEACTLPPGAQLQAGFFGLVQVDHPGATTAADAAWADTVYALSEAQPPSLDKLGNPDHPDRAALPSAQSRASLIARAPQLPVQDLLPDDLTRLFGSERRHAEHDADGTLLSFFCAEHTHVVLRAKELLVDRPHGHILRSGLGLVPDEAALTSTVWMGGVFHSMVTQGHVSINRFLSTQRGLLGQFRALGQRVLVHTGGAWQLLGLPSAWSLQPDGCRWLYRHAQGLLEVRSAVQHQPHALVLELQVLQGPPLALCVTQHIALGGDDGSAAAPVPWQRQGGGVWVQPPEGSELAARFPGGGFAIVPAPGTAFTAIGGDELLAADGRPGGQPYLCLQATAAPQVGLRILGRLLPPAVGPAPAGPDAPAAEPPPALPLPRWAAPAASPCAAAAGQLAEITPWLAHNALVHYLAPRGLEQFSGGGWGTRDVCQGPLEMLLALGRHAPVRDLLLRVFAAQDTGGDWPQWFMFFDRDRHIRASDSHGDIVFWPLLGLARYLLASGDGALLDAAVPFHAATGATPEVAPLWQHLQRALAVTQARRIPGTHLAAYGHGDWNDSLQPADPALRERLCSAWTVTLHHQMLHTLAEALQGLGAGLGAGAAVNPRATRLAQSLRDEAAAVRADFQRLLVVDGQVAGYALFAPAAAAADTSAHPPDGAAPGLAGSDSARTGAVTTPQLLLHPQDRWTGVQHSLLPMMHAILDNLLTPAQAARQLQQVQQHLLGPDGARLFDRPLPYRGGPMSLFQRAESSAFFGREIGVMYMHAHLRWAETLAHLGLADDFFAALCLAHPVALRERVPMASLRQANCYYSSSDAAFADRYEAQAHYGRIASGSVALDGGWRVYSSGPGIAIGLIQGVFLGVRAQARCLVLDPVIAPALSGLQAEVDIAGHRVQVEYRTGPRGCGPQALQLNGAPLPFSRGHNPYRTAAAEVPWPALQALLQAQTGGHRLVVTLG